MQYIRYQLLFNGIIITSEVFVSPPFGLGAVLVIGSIDNMNTLLVNKKQFLIQFDLQYLILRYGASFNNMSYEFGVHSLIAVCISSSRM